MHLCSRAVRTSVLLVLVLSLIAPASRAITPRRETADLDAFVRTRPGGVVGREVRPYESLPQEDALRQAWMAFASRQDGDWEGWLDLRSGLPSLAAGSGIPWYPGGANTLDGPAPSLQALERKAREFLDAHPVLLGRWDGELVLDPDASGPLGDYGWQITFRHVVDGVPVEGSRFDFQLVRGNLVAFGATRWAPVRTRAEPSLDAGAARARLNSYLGLTGAEGFQDLEIPQLLFVAVDPSGLDGVRWTGRRGEGLAHRLVWRFRFSHPAQAPTWVGEVDAHTGEIVAFFDDTRYERVKGGVFPISNDGDCANDGCEEAGFPMPSADYSADGGPDQFTSEGGLYTCATPGAVIETNLAGQFVRVNDNCGSISESVLCDNELDLGVSADTNCSVPAGASPGNTRAARTSYFHLDRVKQKARAYLPSNTWLQGQLTDNVNINATCNAFWNGTVNFYRRGGGCRNTGEIQGVVVHEWGHGMDGNDGGGFDNPSEAYADIVAFFESRESCIGRGFFESGTCSGYGDTCLECTGIRDMDWDKREQHTPATPSGFLTDNCGNGGGPCGKEVHCEGYVSGEAVWDLATRDLPAMGLDADTAWQIADRLWYLSRDGSGGDAYNCSLPSSDGCGTTSWFHKLRLADDDDGDLNNGTPHAGAIFAAFDRHDIACGAAADASNQNNSTCPSLAKPVVTQVKEVTNAVELTWDPVPDAATYEVLRTDLGCDRGQMIVGSVTAPATSFRDDGLANAFTQYYRVQAVGSNGACLGPVSDCITATPQALAGKVRFDQATYGCSSRIGLRVVDANVGASTVSADVWSDTEPTPETVTLTETAPGSGVFVGEIFSTTAPAASDGLLSIQHGDTLTAEYIDADDGEGGMNIPRQHTATGDCVGPAISNVRDENVTVSSATIAWDTDELSDTVLIWGPTIPPDQTATGEDRVTQHQVQLSGLQSCTVYYYEVQSTDTAGNLAADDNGGEFYHFETLGDFGNGPQPCHAGQVTLGQATYACSDTVSFELVDIDLNLDPAVAESATVLVTSTTETGGEVVTVTETGANTSVFTGSITTALGGAAPDGVLQVAGGDVITATYEDADDGTGRPAVSFDTATADCGGPVISDLRIENPTHARFTVRYTTDEPGTTVVEWGFTPALGEIASSGNRVTDHSMTINQFSLCTDVYLRVQSTDALGNTSVADNGGAPFRVSTYDIPGLYWMDDFESGAPGWTLEGEWEAGAPQGLGGSTGLADPTAAYNNDGVLGHDLTGQGAFPGDYEAGVDESAFSPTQDATTWTNTKLLFQRRLNTSAEDSASLWAHINGIGRMLFNSMDTTIQESSYSLQTFDLGFLADGASSFFLEFNQSSNLDGQRSGWNIDDVIVKDGSLPDFGPCGGCATPPAFAGAAEAVDNDACGATGVTVSWEQAVSWGSGGSGTYAVYRDTAPDFTPGPGNLVAAGVSGLAFNDAAAPTDQTLYYLVRAENDETCAGGPNNGGATDDNLVRVAVQETTTQSVPGEVEGVLVNLVGEAHVRLEWPAVASATAYRIYRSTAPQPETFTLLDETSNLFYEDLGQGATADTFYYKVVAVNACGQEGP